MPTLPELPLAATWPVIPGGPTPIRVRRAGYPYPLAFDFTRMSWYLRGCTLMSAGIGWPDATAVLDVVDGWVSRNRAGATFTGLVPGDYAITCDPMWVESDGTWKTEEVRGVLRVL